MFPNIIKLSSPEQSKHGVKSWRSGVGVYQFWFLHRLQWFGHVQTRTLNTWTFNHLLHVITFMQEQVVLLVQQGELVSFSAAHRESEQDPHPRLGQTWFWFSLLVESTISLIHASLDWMDLKRLKTKHVCFCFPPHFYRNPLWWWRTLIHE